MRRVFSQFITGAFLLLIVSLIGTMETARADSTTKPATTTATTQAAINWDEAAKHVGETLTVTGPVVGTHVTAKKQLVLNLGKDYPDTTRFSIMINPGDKEELSESTYKGKTVTVTGKIALYRKAPEVICKSADVTIAP
jgi:DNA/RNA endonuclease YhcR with UshA esterase domain